MSLRDARSGIAAIARSLDVRPDGLLDLAGRRPEAAGWPRPRLLGAFDPLLLGWRSRELVLDNPPEVTTTNGIIKPIVLVEGRAIGTWSLPGGRVRLSLWTTVDQSTSEALSVEATAVESYLSPGVA